MRKSRLTEETIGVPRRSEEGRFSPPPTAASHAGGPRPDAANAPQQFSHPPQPPLAFRVGIVGHRPNRLAHADPAGLAAVVRKILATVQDEVRVVARESAALFAPGEPVLRAISPLAEGTDRLFAEQALDLGWQLCCVMPFTQAEYEKDFAEGTALESGSLHRFLALLDRFARSGGLTRFELDGSREDDGEAYGSGGRVVLSQSDVLLVVWDGERQGKRGGTEDTLAEARRMGTPVIWVDAHAPHAWQRLAPGQGLPDPGPDGRACPEVLPSEDTVRQVVRGSLAVPQPRGDAQSQGAHVKRTYDEPLRDLERYYREHRPKRTLSVVWKAFRDIVGDSRRPSVSAMIAEFETAVEDEWPCDRSSPLKALVDVLRPFYAWPDRLAVLYSDRYRSAFVLAFLLAAAAVGMVLLPSGLGRSDASTWDTVCTVLELAAIMAILLIVLLGRRGKWHERWIDYRLAAELVRHVRLVVPVGGGRPFAQVPAHLATYGQPEATWMDWYVRAVTRAIGLPDVVVDRMHLTECLNQLHVILEGQAKYHGTTARRCRVIEHRLELWGLVLLGITGVACALHLAHLLLPSHTLVFLAGFIPALVAALAGIANQGEFRRVAKRSEAMQQRLRLLVERVEKTKDTLDKESAHRSFTPVVSALASDAAGLLVSEVMDWRVVFLDRPLTVA